MIESQISNELRELLNPGKTIRFFYGKGKPANKVCHIREIVDGDYVVFRSWSRVSQSWNYDIKHWMYFQIPFDSGNLTGDKK